MMERQLDREFSQGFVRIWLKENYNIESETFLKYVYDGYTFRGNYKAIRKPKTRKKIALEFHKQQKSKMLAMKLVDQLIELEGGF